MADETKEEMDGNTYTDNGDYDEDELIKSPLKRVFMVLLSPRLVYESLSKKSSKLDWIIPITLTLLFALIIINSGFEFLRNDQHEAAINRIENNTKLTEEQKADGIERTEKQMERMSGIQRSLGNIFAVVGVFVHLLFMALVMMGVVSVVLKGKLTFDNAFKIGALGSMTSVVGSVVKLPLMFYHESLMQAKMSLGLLFPEGMEENFIVKLVDIDIFILWYVIIISIGMSVFSKKSLSKALLPMVLLWFVFRVAITSISGVLSGLG
ncbi:MAG: hypothetical protein HOC71_13685 [Candidatus Latescibacteria bacterium]|jgi:hypothetical protein|nr:hypothetical protein [Candidatus Latescibacterota bacterium]